MVNIKIEKKGLWFLAGVMVLLIAVAYVMAYGSGDPNVHGHDAGEVDGGNSAYLQLHGKGGGTKSEDFVEFLSLEGPWEIFRIQIKCKKGGLGGCYTSLQIIGDGVKFVESSHSESWEEISYLSNLKGSQSLKIKYKIGNDKDTAGINVIYGN